ncbi:MAG: hypothetical protein ACQCN3_15605 [Candidatus Bathyarchaeia archaeon]|jgi:hypothetical protein
MNFEKAVTRSHENQEFKFKQLSKITKVWKKENYWVVDAFVEYSFPNQKVKTFTFQVNSDSEIIGFDLKEQHTIITPI